MIRLLQSLPAAVLAATWLTTSAVAQTPVERGAYLVNAVMGCDGCHTPRGPGGFDMSRRFSGGSQVLGRAGLHREGLQHHARPRHRHRHMERRRHQEADDRRHAAERRAGRARCRIAFYKILTPRDLDAVVAYIKSVAPVRNEVQPPIYKAALHTELIPGAEKPFGNDVLTDPVKRGFYLATWRIAWSAMRGSPRAGRTM